MKKPKDCTCEFYKRNESHEYTCALNINQAIKRGSNAMNTPNSTKAKVIVREDKLPRYDIEVSSVPFECVYCDKKEVAENIVKAVNRDHAFDALVEALAEVKEGLTTTKYTKREVIELVRQALKLAR